MSAIDSSHAFTPWTRADHGYTEARVCTGCGAAEDRSTPEYGGETHYHGHAERLERPCGAPEPREGILAPKGAEFLGGVTDPERRYSWFAMRYPLVQDDGSVLEETIPFPVAESWGVPVGADPYPKPKRGVGGQTFE